MECAVCRHLETDLDRLERIHAEKLRIAEEKRRVVRRDEYSRLKDSESDARLALEITRGELKRHKRKEHGEK
jgi:hypothetical protein